MGSHTMRCDEKITEYFVVYKPTIVQSEESNSGAKVAPAVQTAASKANGTLATEEVSKPAVAETVSQNITVVAKIEEPSSGSKVDTTVQTAAKPTEQVIEVAELGSKPDPELGPGVGDIVHVVSDGVNAEGILVQVPNDGDKWEVAFGPPLPIGTKKWFQPDTIRLVRQNAPPAYCNAILGKAATESDANIQKAQQKQEEDTKLIPKVKGSPKKQSQTKSASGMPQLSKKKAENRLQDQDQNLHDADKKNNSQSPKDAVSDDTSVGEKENSSKSAKENDSRSNQPLDGGDLVTVQEPLDSASGTDALGAEKDAENTSDKGDDSSSDSVQNKYALPTWLKVVTAVVAIPSMIFGGWYWWKSRQLQTRLAPRFSKLLDSLGED